MRESLLRFLPVLLLPVCLSGCASIPLWSAKLSERVTNSSREGLTKTLASTALDARIDPGSASVEAVLTAVHETKWTEMKTIEESQSQRRIIVGLFPAIGQAMYTKGPRAVDMDEAVLGAILSPLAADIACPFHNLILEPFFNTWDESLGPGGDWDAFCEGCCMVGWSKASAERTVTRVVREPKREVGRRQPMVGVPVRLTVLPMGLSRQADTTREGLARLDVAAVPVFTRQPLQVRLDAPDVQKPPQPVTIEVAAGLFGRDLDLWAGPASLSTDTVYVAGETVDYSTGPAPSPPSPSARTEIVGRKPGLWGVRVTVENKGVGPLYRVLARSKSDEAPLDKHLLVVGKVGPGQSVTRDLAIPLPDDFRPGRYKVAIEFREANGNAPPTEEMLVEIE